MRVTNPLLLGITNTKEKILDLRILSGSCADHRGPVLREAPAAGRIPEGGVDELYGGEAAAAERILTPVLTASSTTDRRAQQVPIPEGQSCSLPSSEDICGSSHPSNNHLFDHLPSHSRSKLRLGAVQLSEMVHFEFSPFTFGLRGGCGCGGDSPVS